MPTQPNFKGFSKESVKFYEDLKKNNKKEWFAEHKGDFETHVMAPARDFVFAMGESLKKISPNVQADPRVNGSIFRPYRDTRFSKDKTPYKTHLGIFFWEGERQKMECPGYYFHLEPPEVMLGVGIHGFSPPLLAQYRDSVVHGEHGPALAKALEKLKKKGDYSVGIKHYKKTPRGFDPGHRNAELLLHNGLTLAYTTNVPKEFYSARFVDYCFGKFQDMSPIQKWLLEMIRRMEK